MKIRFQGHSEGHSTDEFGEKKSFHRQKHHKATPTHIDASITTALMGGSGLPAGHNRQTCTKYQGHMSPFCETVHVHFFPTDMMRATGRSADLYKTQGGEIRVCRTDFSFFQPF